MVLDGIVQGVGIFMAGLTIMAGIGVLVIVAFEVLMMAQQGLTSLANSRTRKRQAQHRKCLQRIEELKYQNWILDYKIGLQEELFNECKKRRQLK